MRYLTNLRTLVFTRIPLQRTWTNRWVVLITTTVHTFSSKNGPTISAGVAYFALFSVFPLILTIIAVIGYLFSDVTKQLDLVSATQKLVPVSTLFLSETMQGVVNNRGPLSLIATFGLLWSGLAVFSALRKGINHAWDVKSQPNLIKGRLMDLIIAIGVVSAIFIKIVLLATLFEMARIGESLYTIGGELLIKIPASFLSFSITFIVLLLLYKYVPNRQIRWQDIWLGTLAGALLFEGNKLVVAFYFSRFSDFNLVYGSLGGLMIILAWVYISSFIVLFAAQFCAVYFRIIGSGRDNP